MYERNAELELNQGKKIIKSAVQPFGATKDFIKNYNDMKRANTIGADKYFHAKANSDASKRGKLGELTAQVISATREIVDVPKNILFKKMTLEESLKDSKEDLKANKYGRKQGRKNPKIDSRVLIDKYRPKGLPEKY